MNKLWLFTAFLTFLSGICIAQSPGRGRIYSAWVNTGGHSEHVYLAGFSDSDLFTSNLPVAFMPNLLDNSYKKISYSFIDKITIRRKGSTSRGMVTGAIIGVLGGAAIGFADGDDKNKTSNSNGGFFSGGCIFCMTAGEKAAIGGVTLGAVGAGMGALIGGLKQKRFDIDRQKSKFDEMKQYMLSKITSSPLGSQ